MARRRRGRRRSNNDKVLIGVLAGILVIVACIFIGVLMSGSNPVTKVFRPDLDEDATMWDGERQTEETESKQEGIKIPGYPTLSLPANTQTVFLGIQNPEGNPCYFTYTLYLKDTEEVLYTSKMVAPGQSITEATLTRALSPGEYPAVLNISTNSLEDGSPMNGANMETVLVVK